MTIRRFNGPATSAASFLTIVLPLVGCMTCWAQSHPGAPLVQPLTLSQALDIALNQNRQISISRLQFEQANQRVAQAKSSLFPVLNVQVLGGELLDPVRARFPKGILGSVNGSPVPGQDTNVSSNSGFAAVYNIVLGQPLSQIPRIRTGIRALEVGREIAREQERQQRLTITSNVRQAYFALLQTQDTITTTNASLKALQELERNTADRVAQQSALRADLLDVQAQVAAREVALSAQLDALQQVKEQMNVLLGRDVEVPFQVAPETDKLPLDTDRDKYQARALRSRPDLRRSALQIRLAELDLRSSRLSYLPELSLAMDYFGLGKGVNGVPDHLWILGAQLSWQPFDWGKRRHEIAEKTNVIAQARLADQEARAATQVDVDNQIRRERQAHDQLRAAQAARTAAGERLRVTLNQYQAQAALLKDVLQAQAALADADRQVQDAGLAYLTAQSELRRASGEE